MPNVIQIGREMGALSSVKVS